MRVLILGEGANEEAALPTLVKRLNGHIHDQEFRRFKDHPSAKFHGIGGGLFKKAVRWMLDAQKQGFDGVVILVDHDGDETRPGQMDQAQGYSGNQPLPPRACGVAIREFDAWFLADEQALTRVIGRPIGRQPDPEHRPDPKGDVEGLIAESAYNSRSALYSDLAPDIDLDRVRSRCPRGFAPFAARVGAMVLHG